jgi:hypothetical protein
VDEAERSRWRGHDDFYRRLEGLTLCSSMGDQVVTVQEPPLARRSEISRSVRVARIRTRDTGNTAEQARGGITASTILG